VDFTLGRTGFLASLTDPGQVGHIAFAAGVELSTLHRQKSGLEESFLALVGGGHSL
jgi:ABC-2 type transport system ATP-binding protein